MIEKLQKLYEKRKTFKNFEQDRKQQSLERQSFTAQSDNFVLQRLLCRHEPW